MITTIRLTLLTLLGCGVAYPLVVFAFGQTVAPAAAQGSLAHDDGGQLVGSRLVAQSFEHDEYLWPRPSAAEFDAAAAGGSNMAGSNPDLRTRAEATLDRLGARGDTMVPAELVAASGSGLDPHLTLDGAEYQAPRIARVRHVAESRVLEVLRRSATPPISSRPALVNVLTTNLALDRELGSVSPER